MEVGLDDRSGEGYRQSVNTLCHVRLLRESGGN